jgi:hypothetical protein
MKFVRISRLQLMTCLETNDIQDVDNVPFIMQLTELNEAMGSVYLEIYCY